MVADREGLRTILGLRVYASAHRPGYTVRATPYGLHRTGCSYWFTMRATANLLIIGVQIEIASVIIVRNAGLYDPALYALGCSRIPAVRHAQS